MMQIKEMNILPFNVELDDNERIVESAHHKYLCLKQESWKKSLCNRLKTTGAH